jgi:hypothetical protein
MSQAIAEASPEVIAAFMQQVIVQYQNYGTHHRRAEPREAIAIPVQIQRLDDDLTPIDEPQPAITRDISVGGIGIFHAQPYDHGMLRIRMVAPESHEQMQILARIEHCTPCGGYYIIGCRFAGGLA